MSTPTSSDLKNAITVLTDRMDSLPVWVQKFIEALSERVVALESKVKFKDEQIEALLIENRQKSAAIEELLLAVERQPK